MATAMAEPIVVTIGTGRKNIELCLMEGTTLQEAVAVSEVRDVDPNEIRVNGKKASIGRRLEDGDKVFLIKKK